MDPLVLKALEFGATGALAIALVLLFRHLVTVQRDHAAELKALHETHRRELAELNGRHSSKVENMIEHSHLVEGKLAATLESLEEKLQVRKGQR